MCSCRGSVWPGHPSVRVLRGSACEAPQDEELLKVIKNFPHAEQGAPTGRVSKHAQSQCNFRLRHYLFSLCWRSLTPHCSGLPAFTVVGCRTRRSPNCAERVLASLLRPRAAAAADHRQPRPAMVLKEGSHSPCRWVALLEALAGATSSAATSPGEAAARTPREQASPAYCSPPHRRRPAAAARFTRLGPNAAARRPGRAQWRSWRAEPVRHRQSLQGHQLIAAARAAACALALGGLDLADVQGPGPKRALEIAAAFFHNLLISDPINPSTIRPPAAAAGG